jgi:uncharacterized membrane protein YqjE
VAVPGRGAAEPRSTRTTRTMGLGASLKRLGSTLIAVLHSRAELISHELARERVSITRLLVLGVAALFFLALGAITATIFVIVLFWDSQRLIVIGFLTVLYLGIGGGIAVFAQREAGRAKRPFSTTVEQLKKDREYFTRH